MRNPKAGDRAIALMPWRVRLWGRVRGDRIRTWAAAKAGPWDQAVAASSPLRAALHRLLLYETDHQAGVTTASLFIDIKEFYDSISPAKVINAALDLEFPPVAWPPGS